MCQLSKDCRAYSAIFCAINGALYLVLEGSHLSRSQMQNKSSCGGCSSGLVILVLYSDHLTIKITSSTYRCHFFCFPFQTMLMLFLQTPPLTDLQLEVIPVTQLQVHLPCYNVYFGIWSVNKWGRVLIRLRLFPEGIRNCLPMTDQAEVYYLLLLVRPQLECLCKAPLYRSWQHFILLNFPASYFFYVY